MSPALGGGREAENRRRQVSKRRNRLDEVRRVEDAKVEHSLRSVRWSVKRSAISKVELKNGNSETVPQSEPHSLLF